MIEIKHVEEALIESRSLLDRYEVELILEKDIGDVWPVFNVDEFRNDTNIIILSDYILAREGRAFYDCDKETIIKYAYEAIMYFK